MFRFGWSALDPFDRGADPFDAFLGDLAATPNPSFPAVNVWEDDESILVEAEVPGLRREDLDVTVQGQQLTLSGERRTDTYNDATAYRRERAIGRFRRTLHLPVAVEADQVTANAKDGLLTVRLPKAESAKARRIEVRPVMQIEETSGS